MDPNKCILKWESFSDHLKQMLQSLIDDKHGQDVTLVCDDKVKLKAHKFVLKSCSPVFGEILNCEENSVSSIYLRGINHQEMKSILNFMYLGETTVNIDKIEDFMNVSKSLEIKELCNQSTVQVKSEPQKNEETADEDLNKNDVSENSKVSIKRIAKKNNKVKDDLDEKEVKLDNKGHYLKSSNGQFCCTKCDYEAKAIQSVVRHFQRVHEGIQYPCNQRIVTGTERRCPPRFNVVRTSQAAFVRCPHIGLI